MKIAYPEFVGVIKDHMAHQRAAAFIYTNESHIVGVSQEEFIYRILDEGIL